MLMRGETITVEKIPIGVMQPKTDIETGAVAVCAPTEAASEVAIFSGKAFIKTALRMSEKIRIPARERYESIKAIS